MKQIRQNPRRAAQGLENAQEQCQALSFNPEPPQVAQAVIQQLPDGVDVDKPEVAKFLKSENYIKIQGSGVEQVRPNKFRTEHDIRPDFTPLPKEEQPDDYNLLEDFSAYLVEHGHLMTVRRNSSDSPQDFALYRYHPDSRTWRPDGPTHLNNLVNEYLGLRKQNPENAIKRGIAARAMRDLEDMGAPDGHVAVKNGLLNLQGGGSREIRKDDYVLNKLPVSFDGDLEDFNPAEEEYPQIWMDFLEKCVPEEQKRKKLQEFAGYTLMPWTAKHGRALLLLGPTDTGKSVFLETIQAMLGDENTASQSLKKLADTRWAVDKIVGKMANIYTDLDTKIINDTGVIKVLADGEGIDAERKCQPKYEAKPTCKHMFSANMAVEPRKMDTAFLNRFLVVPFTNQIPEDEQDPQLKSDLRQPEVLEGVFRWALEGYLRLEAQDGFTADLRPLATREFLERHGSGPKRFVHKFCDFEHKANNKGTENRTWNIVTNKLRTAYNQWASGRAEFDQYASQGNFTREVTRVNGVSKSMNSKNRRTYTGILFKDGLENADWCDWDQVTEA